MGATVSTIWFVETLNAAAILRTRPAPDPDTALALAERLYPGRGIDGPQDATLADQQALGSDEVLIGSYPGLTVLCAGPLARPRPSELATRFVHPVAAGRTVLVATNPQHEWGGFAEWEGLTLRRSFSATRVHIHEDQGLPQSWELPYWSGEHPIVPDPQNLPDPLWLPFDPELFAMAANRQWLGFDYTDLTEDADPSTDPATTRVCRFLLHPAPAVPPPPVSPAWLLAPDPARGRLRRWLRHRSTGRLGHD